MDLLDEILREGHWDGWAEQNPRFVPAIAQLYTEGLTLKQLGKLFRTSCTTICRVLDREGVARRDPAPRGPAERQVDRAVVENILKWNKITLQELEELQPAGPGRPRRRDNSESAVFNGR
jgi:hypothetical protein